jgi:hypothetical protein
MPITRKTLRQAGFTEYDPQNCEPDPHCVGYFDKRLAADVLHVSFWKFPGERGQQVNFEILARDRDLSLDLEMRGVPKVWTVAELEAYVAGLLERIKRTRSATAPRRARKRER